MPNAQGTAAVAPAPLQEPAGVTVHAVRMVLLLYSPARHGMDALSPCVGQLLPTGQGVHARLPVTGMYMPGMHGTGAAILGDGHLFPTGHVVQPEAPVAL